MEQNITFKEVEIPNNYQCDSGHKAPKLYKRNGPESDLLPIRFWHMTGCGINKVICEPCMTIINYLIQQRMKNNGKGS